MQLFARLTSFPRGLLIALLFIVTACGGTTSSSPIPTNTPARSVSTSQPGTRVAARPTITPTVEAGNIDCTKPLVGGRTPSIPRITLTILIACRPQVRDTVGWIATGKFNYRQDDQTFGNREKYLPTIAEGNAYREYTVPTPGEGDRGARRLVTLGAKDRKSVIYTTIYYTDDHYSTFWQVVSGGR
jgi:ribonuclease T1